MWISDSDDDDDDDEYHVRKTSVINYCSNTYFIHSIQRNLISLKWKYSLLSVCMSLALVSHWAHILQLQGSLVLNIVQYAVNYLSSSPDSQKVSVELSVRLPIIACLLDALISTLLVRSLNVSTKQVTLKT